MAKTRLKLVSPATVKRTVTPPRRRPNAELRPREHLTEREVEKLIEATKGNRYSATGQHHDPVCFRHGLRASEVCELQWTDVEFETGTLHLRGPRAGQPATHPLLGDELRALRALKREAKSPFIFVSERGAPFSVCRPAEDGRACRRSRPSCPSRSIRTCCVMRRALLWPIRGQTQERCRPISGIARSNRQCVTPN